MRASTFLTFFGLASTVFSSPLVKKQESALAAIEADVSSVATAVNGDLSAILTAAKVSANDVSAQVQLIAVINADLADIKSQFEGATSTIVTSTTGLVTTLTAPEVQGLTTALNTIAALAKSLQADFATLEKELSAATFAAIKAEYEAAVAAISPFVNPLTAYAAKVTIIGQSGISAILSSLKGAVSGTKSAVSTLLTAV